MMIEKRLPMSPSIPTEKSKTPWTANSNCMWKSQEDASRSSSSSTVDIVELETSVAFATDMSSPSSPMSVYKVMFSFLFSSLCFFVPHFSYFVRVLHANSWYGISYDVSPPKHARFLVLPPSPCLISCLFVASPPWWWWLAIDEKEGPSSPVNTLVNACWSCLCSLFRSSLRTCKREKEREREINIDFCSRCLCFFKIGGNRKWEYF